MASRTYAVLLDGGFIKFALKKGKKDAPIDAALLQAFLDSIQRHPALSGSVLHRVYYYDAKPLTGKYKRPDGVEVDFSNSQMYQISTKQHQTFARLPFVAMRFGELTYRGWKVRDGVANKAKPIAQIQAKDLEANVQQKGVDMRIGLDIACIALKHQANIIVLVSADSDLIPAMKLARREGSQLFLVPLANPLKEGMHEHADLVIEGKDWIAYPAKPAEK